jgi:ribonuclease HI
LDESKRAEMKYRESDERIYRPALSNLSPLGTKEESSSPKPPIRRQHSGSGSHRLDAASTSSQVIHIWTDGACSGNPGPMGIGMVVIAGDKRQEVGEYLGVGTNNIAELTAILRGLEIAQTLVSGTLHSIRVYSDSSYAIGLLKDGWKAKANQELVAKLRRVAANFPNLSLVKVAGHAGIPENERCDLLARQAIATRRP